MHTDQDVYTTEVQMWTKIIGTTPTRTEPLFVLVHACTFMGSSILSGIVPSTGLMKTHQCFLKEAAKTSIFCLHCQIMYEALLSPSNFSI